MRIIFLIMVTIVSITIFLLFRDSDKSEETIQIQTHPKHPNIASTKIEDKKTSNTSSNNSEEALASENKKSELNPKIISTFIKEVKIISEEQRDSAQRMLHKI